MSKFRKKVHRFHRLTGDPGGTIINKAVNKTWDRPGNARGALMPYMPTPPGEPPAVPMPDEEDLQRARRRSTRSQMQRSGRSSTILSDSDRLGP
jgi:hypothetical protein